MAKFEKVLAISGDLFENAPQTLDVDAALRQSINAAFRASSKSRTEIAEEMSRLIGRRVTVSQLNHFTAETKTGYRFPAAWLPAFCVAIATRCDVLQLLSEATGKYRLVTRDEAMLIELARAYLARKKAAETIDQIESQLLEGERLDG